MYKQIFSTIVPEDLNKEFRETVERQGKKYDLALEEAMKLWIETKEKNNDSSSDFNKTQK